MKEGDSCLKERDTSLKERDTSLKEGDASLKEGDSCLKERDTSLKDEFSIFNIGFVESLFIYFIQLIYCLVAGEGNEGEADID